MIVEASASGREVECSVLGNEEVETSLPGEIDAHAEWYDFEAKYASGGMELIVPARIDERRGRRVRELAAEVFGLAGCNGLARCDFFVEPGGGVLVNEINTIPGFTETSVYAKLFEASGVALPRSLRPPRRAWHRAPPTGPLVRVLRLLEQAHVADLDRSPLRRQIGDPDQVVAESRSPASSGISSVLPTDSAPPT